MTEPDSRLAWFPDPLSALVVRASWVDAVSHYTIDWGDGTSERVLSWEPPTKHAYPHAGAYTVVATAETPGCGPVSARVVVRDHVHARGRVDLLPESSAVRLTLPDAPEPVLWEVDWGDGKVTEHGASDTAPEHEYTPGRTGSVITVRDVPARRTSHVAVPEPRDQPPVKADPRTAFRLTAPNGTGVLELHGFPPHTVVHVGRVGLDGHGTPAGDVTTDARGHASRACTLVGPDSSWIDSWQSIQVRWTDPATGRFRQLWQPVQVSEWQGAPARGVRDETSTDGDDPVPRRHNGFPLWIDWQIGAPHVITVLSAQIPDGDYTVQWEDGVTELVPVTDGHLRATHDYGSIRAVRIEVTNPQGRTARRSLRQIRPVPSTREDGTLAVVQPHYGGHLGHDDCDPYSVMRVECGDGRPLVQVHRPGPGCSTRSGNGFAYARAGEYRVTIHGPMSEPVTHLHRQNAAGATGEDEFAILEPRPAPAPLSQTFHVGDISRRGRYSAYFEIVNRGEQPVPWQLDFTLARPAALADVHSWVGAAAATDLGGGRWRITCDQPARVRDPFRLEIAVDPSGDPQVWPTDIDLSSPPPRDGEEQQ